MRFKWFVVLVLLCNILQAQNNNNIFLDRAFWKAKPSLELVKAKVKEGHNPSEFNRHSFDAIAYGLLEKPEVVSDAIIKYLLTQKGNDVNKLTHDGRTYIFWAAYTNRLELMKYLVSKGAKTDVIDNHGYTVFNFAATTGQKNIELYDYLISQGANPKNEKNHEGANALLLFIPSAKDFKVVDYLISKGLSLNDTDDKGNGVVNYAAKKGNKTIIEALIAKGLPYKSRNENGGNAMIMATKGGRKGYNSLAFFKYLEGLGVAPNITNKDGSTPLHNLASGNKDIETLQYFIDKGVNVNQQDTKGNTPLLKATIKNSLEAIKLLYSKTKAINLKNKKGQSALTNSLRNTPEVVQFLLDNGADATIIDNKGRNLAYYLVDSYSSKKDQAFLKKIKLLSNKGFDVKTPQKNGNTLVHLAADKGDLSLLKQLKEFGVDINAKNNDGLTALQKAVMVAKNPKLVKFLLEHGADKSVTTGLDETIYDLAKENEQLSQFDLKFLK